MTIHLKAKAVSQWKKMMKLKIQFQVKKIVRCNFSTDLEKSHLKKKIKPHMIIIINQGLIKLILCSVRFAWKTMIWKKESLWSWDVVIHFVKNALNKFILFRLAQFNALLTKKLRVISLLKMWLKIIHSFICLNANNNRIRIYCLINSAKFTTLKNRYSIASMIIRWFASSVC